MENAGDLAPLLPDLHLAPPSRGVNSMNRLLSALRWYSYYDRTLIASSEAKVRVVARQSLQPP